jgi:hypothetical protein
VCERQRADGATDVGAAAQDSVCTPAAGAAAAARRGRWSLGDVAADAAVA